MHKIFMQEVYGNGLSTIVAFFVILIASLLLEFLVYRKITSRKRKHQLRVRSFYVTCFVFLFFMAKIWVDGFSNLLAVLGFVSAALVITNKETIMNIVGWFIINWRGLFSEDDLIQIQHYKGYVKSFGMFYFTLAEISESRNGDITGRLIRIPNGLVSTIALINFSQTSDLLEQTFTMIIDQDVNVEHTMEFVTRLVNYVTGDYYTNNKEYSKEYLRKNHKYLSTRINLDASVSAHPKFDAPSGLELKAHYYCFSQDAEKIQQKIWIKLLTELKKEKRIKLVYE